MRNRKFLIEEVENLLFYLMPTRRRKLLRGIDSIQCLKAVLTNQMRKIGIFLLTMLFVIYDLCRTAQ